MNLVRAAFVGIVALSANFATADLLEELRQCRNICSQSCMDLAADASSLAREVQNHCGGGGGADIVIACKDSFVGTSNEQTCIQTAHTATAVIACVDHFVGTQEELRCVANARNAEIVVACKEGFIGTDVEQDCIRRARSAERVRVCKDSFVGTQEELNCIGQ